MERKSNETKKEVGEGEQSPEGKRTSSREKRTTNEEEKLKGSAKKKI